MDALFEPVLGQAGDAEQLDAEAQLVREADIEPRDVTDALGINAVGVDRSAEGEARQDRQLVRGIDAVDVEARISLGITELLRLGQHLGEFPPAVAHCRQDVVRCAVEDAVDPRHAVAGKALAQCLDNRDPAGDGGLEGERDAGLLGAPGKARSVLGDQRLIGGDDVLAASQRGLDDVERDSIGAADQLDDRIDFRIGRHGGGVLVPAHRRQIDAAVAPPVAGRGRDDDDAASGAQTDRFGLPLQKLDGRGADRAEPGNGDLQGWLHR